jgi:putative glycosyltransferase (TIGR04372 family)
MYNNINFLSLINRLYKRKYSIILFPFYIPIAFLFYFFNIRFISLLYNKIGHLVVEPEIYYKKRLLGLYPTYKTFIYTPIDKVANKHFLHYLNKLDKVYTLNSKFLNFIFKPFWLFPFLRLKTDNFAVAHNETSEWAKISKLWQSHKPILELDINDKIFGDEILKKIGLKNTWFVCFHVRESGYSKNDEHFHSFRNANIDSYFPAMEYIIKLGGACIRMGDSTMNKLPPIVGVFDYAHSEYRSDRMDIFLCANCRFFLGTASGLLNLASIFGRPLAITNLAPLSMALMPNPNDRSIFKIYKSSKDNELLSFKQIFESEPSNYRHTIDFMNNKIELIDNTDEEILNLCEEMMFSESISSIDPELQLKFKNLMNPKHYTFGAVGNIGSKFLEKYKILLD